MQFVSGNFWTRKEKEERTGRPCLDEKNCLMATEM
jgi:hypothetical protein